MQQAIVTSNVDKQTKSVLPEGYMDEEFLITDELARRKDDVEKLSRLTNILKQLPQERIELEKNKLEKAIESSGVLTKKIVEHAKQLHAEYVGAVMELVSTAGGISKEAYSRYLIQGWYHTRYTPRFEQMFTENLEALFKSSPQLGGFAGIDDKDNKFAKLSAHNIDEEEGHELWALMDIQQVGVCDKIDVMHDVYPETKAIVWSQHDRLTRLPNIGFLGYSFYLEYLIASHSLTLCDVLCAEFGSERSDNRFIYFHFLVDQGHSIDNLQLFDRLVRTEQDMKEVIDNMNFIHAMYKGMTVRALSSAT